MAMKAFALAREKKAHSGVTLRDTGARGLRDFSEGTPLRHPGNYYKSRSRAVPQGARTSKNKSNGKDKIKGTPPRSSPALRAREEAESDNGRLHRVRGLPFPIPHSPFPVYRH
jgi:hypothetical protein